MKKLFLKSLAIGLMALLPAMSWAQSSTLTVNDGTETNEYVPMYGYYADTQGQHSQFVIPAAKLTDIASGSVISSLKFFTTSGGAWGSPIWSVKMAEGENVSLSSAFYTMPSNSTVYSGSLNVQSNAMIVTLSSEYSYGGKDLVIDFEVTTKGSYSHTYFSGVSSSGLSRSNSGSGSGSSQAFSPKVEITYGAPPSCAKPKLLLIPNILSETATITWTAGGTETQWQYVYGVKGFTPDWTNPSSIGTASVTLNGLDAKTEYDFYVRAYCSDSDQSDPTKVSFQTACAATEIVKGTSFEEGFESWTTNGFEDCWNRTTYTYSSTNYPCCVANGSGSYSKYSRSGSKCLAFYGGTSDAINYVVFPLFSEDISKLHLIFYYKNYSTSSYYGQFAVGTMTNPSNPSTFEKIEDLQRTTSYTMYDKELTNISGKKYIAIKFYNGSSYKNYSYIDDIEISLIPTCIVPTALTFNSATTTSVTFGWTKGKDETKWNVQYKEAGATDWIDVSGVVTSNPYTLTDLQPATFYNVRVRAYCSADDQSEWSNALTLSTDCSDVLPSTYSTGFEYMTTGQAPKCWSCPLGTIAVAQQNPKTGSNSLKFGSNTLSNNVAVMPALNKETNKLQVTFWSRPEANNAYCGTFSVGYVTDASDASTFVAVATYEYTESTTMSEKEVALNAAPNGARIAFRHQPTAGNWFWFIDDVSISDLPSCIKPVIDEPALTSSSATFTWTAGGSETQWIYVAGAKDFTPDWSTATLVNKNSATISGLKGNTEYDFYVRSYCSETDTSKATKYAFRTNCGELEFDKTYSFEEDASSTPPMCWGVYTISGGTLPSVSTSYVRSGKKSLSMSYAYSNGKTAWAVMPKVPEDINVADLKVSAYAYGGNTNYSCLDVGVMTNPADFNTFQSCGYTNPLPVLTSKTSPCSEVKLDKITNGGKYIAFVIKSYATAYLDTITVFKLLERPTNIQVDADNNSADVTFDQVNPTGKWEYRLNGGTPVSITSQEFTILGLTGSTNYSLEIREYKESTGEYSGWVAKAFSTACEDFALSATNPFSEDFADKELPACWNVVCSSATPASYTSENIHFSAIAAYFLPKMDFTNLAADACMLNFDASNSLSNVKILAAASLDGITPENIGDYVIAEITVDVARTYNVYLSDYASQLTGKSYIGFMNTASQLVIDNVELKKAPAVRKPKEVTIGNIKYNQASIVSLTQEDQVVGGTWGYEIDTVNTFDSEAFDMGEFTEMPAVISNLDATTTYYVRVKYIVDLGESDWSDVVSFPTSCAPMNFNNVYDFENVNASTTKNYYEGSDQYFSSCWTRGTTYPNNSGNYNYMPYVYKGSDAQEGQKCMLMWGTTSYPDYFALPAFEDPEQDMTEVNVTFYAKATSSSLKTLRVGTTSGISADGKTANFTLVKSLQLTTSYAKYEVKFEDYEGTDKQIMFYSDSAGQSFPICIDSVKIVKILCKSPKPGISNTTTTSAVLASGLTSGADWAWKFEGGEENKVDGTKASTTITNLTADTEYTVLVQAQCGGDAGNSDWKSVTFHTACAPVDALGYSEALTSVIPFCMKVVKPASDSKCEISASSLNMKNAAIVLPELTSDEWENLMMTFDAKSNISNPEIMLIAYKDTTGAILADQQVLDTIKLSSDFISNEIYFGDYANITSILSEKRLAIKSTTTDAYIKNIMIKAAGGVRRPINLAKVADSETSEGASFTFEQTGTPTNVWVVEVSKSTSFSPVLIRDTIEAQSFVLTGLQMKTDYNVRVKQMNGEESSIFSNVVKFTTLCGTIAMDVTDDLESYLGNTGTSGYTTNVPNCWAAGNESNYNVHQYAYIYSNSNKAHSVSNVLSISCYVASYSKKMTWMAMPEVGVADLSNLELTFWASSSSTSTMEVGIMSDPSSKNTYVKIADVALTSTMTPDTVKFADYSGPVDLSQTDKKHIVFMNNKTSSTFYIDDIKLTENLVWTLLRDNLSADQVGTACQEKNITDVRGGVLYGVNYGTTASIEFVEKELPIAAGEPLLFQADGSNDGKIEVVYGSSTATAPVGGEDGVRGFVGNLSSATSNIDIAEGNILVSGGMLRLAGTGCYMGPGRAYIKASELPDTPITPASAPGRRLVLTQNGIAVATGADEVMINNIEGVQKIVRDGQLIIIRGGQLFNAQGQKL